MFDVSDKALERIKTVCSKKNNDNYFRISVNGGGCQGFSYSFNFDSKIKDDDVVPIVPDTKVQLGEISKQLKSIQALACQNMIYQVELSRQSQLISKEVNYCMFPLTVNI